MKKKTKEKRESKRAFFTIEDNLSASITTHREPVTTVPVTLLSVSAGGISFFAARQKISGIREGDRLTITGIQTPDPLGSIDTVEAQIKYILDLEINIRIVFGCEFTKISASCVKKIEEYVEYRLREMGLEDKVIRI